MHRVPTSIYIYESSVPVILVGGRVPVWRHMMNILKPDKQKGVICHWSANDRGALAAMCGRHEDCLQSTTTSEDSHT
jgi:hypothetical protein